MIWILLACAGDTTSDDSGDTAGVPLAPAVMVEAGVRHTCALLEDGTVTCWGQDDEGQSTAPEGNYSEVSAGNSFTCAIVADLGVPFCWGLNDVGQCSATTDAYEHVVAGGFHGCAWDEGGGGTCWGRDENNRLALPEAPLAMVDAGRHNTCALTTEGVLSCTGLTPEVVASPEGVFRHVDLGAEQACAVREEGSLVCWGDGDLWESTPTTGSYVQVSVGVYHACALSEDQLITCWGDNAERQGNAPAWVFSDMTAGGFHTCAMDILGEVSCWGQDSYGQTSTPF